LTTAREPFIVRVICASVPRLDVPATGVYARYRQLDAISVDTLTASPQAGMLRRVGSTRSAGRL